MARVISIGEVMVELSRGKDSRYGLACGGDTFNTAVYLARLGVETAYATALGDDPYSDAILAVAKAESLDTSLVARVPGALPGLYIIDTDDKGERRFHYWRDSAPARRLFEIDGWGHIAEALAGASLVYLSGITLSLYSNTGLGRLLATLELARERGAKIAFDGNYRPRGWGGDVARARTVMSEALRRTDIALPTYGDEAALFGDASPSATLDRFEAFGIGEIVVKNGADGAHLRVGGKTLHVPVDKRVDPVDTTAAGDSFNAAYLAGRLASETPEIAARAAHRLAAHVLMHRGAIAPRPRKNGTGAVKVSH